ncbi:hypothetical protein AB833_16050 [Chromatiales bacterium (ex Bugula neritina AB1)]|nr:hypothetical protein AB833_16050 [Chromatiales bacterium (ex Bugula neritina AB1)]
MDTIDSNTNILVAAPSEPTDKSLMQQLSRCVADIEEVREAHLPAVIEIGQASSARLTLVVVVRQNADKKQISNVLAGNMKSHLSAADQIDTRVVADDFPLLDSIRATGCVVGWRD